MGKLNTSDYSYTDFTDEVNLYTGGISNEVNVTGDVQRADCYQVKYEVRLKTLKSNLSRGVELIRSMMLSTQFTDENVFMRCWHRLNPDFAMNSVTAVMWFLRQGHYLIIQSGQNMQTAFRVSDFMKALTGLWQPMRQKNRN